MNVVLWVVQTVLAVAFGASGLLKLAQPRDALVGKFPWMQDFAPATVRFIGVTELLGAIGLVAPAASGIAPVLTPLAAIGLAVLMVLAAAVHVRRHELQAVAVTAVLFVVPALLAWARLGPYAW